MASGDTTWRDALILDAPRIAGLRVRPLSAWHCHVAQMVDVRLGIGENGRGPTPGDVAAAIAICRTTYRADRAGIPIAGKLLRAYLNARWMFRAWQRDAEDLIRYVDAYRRYPEIVRQSDRQGQPLGCPQYFAVAVEVVMRLPSVSFEAALNMPLVSLYCLRATITEMSGGPSCAWRVAPADDEVQNALAIAQAAIDRLNSEKGVPHGGSPN